MDSNMESPQPPAFPSSALAVIHRRVGLNIYFAYFQAHFVGSALLEFCKTWGFSPFQIVSENEAVFVAYRVVHVPWSFDGARGEGSFCATSSSPQCHCPFRCPFIFFGFLLSPKGINMTSSPIKRSFLILTSDREKREWITTPGKPSTSTCSPKSSRSILRCCFPQSCIGLDIHASLGGTPERRKRLITLHFGKEKWELNVVPVHGSSLFSGQVKCQG